MKNIDVERKIFGFTRRQFYIFLGVSAVWLICCFALLIPPIRNLGISLGEAFVHRPLTHLVWHERFISLGINGIILYVVMFLLIFADSFSPVIAGKKLDVFVITFSLLAVFAILYKANWVFSDDHEYITTTAINKYVPFKFSGGRFMPFRFIEYNLPLFVFRCFGINTGLPVEAHFTVIAIFYIVTVFCLYFLCQQIEPVKTTGIYPVFNRFFSVLFFLLGSSFFSVFFSLIYPETQVIMLFSIFMLMYYKALKTDKILYYVVALVSAVYSTYCKEPVFGVFLIIAFINYLFRYNLKTKKEKIFYIALVANGILFIVLYYFLSFKNATGFYNEGRVSISRLDFFFSIIKENPVLIIIFCFGLYRLDYVIVRKERDYLFYDSLLFAGIGYIFAYCLLHLNAGYYYLPSIILFLPSLVHWVKYFFERKRIYAVVFFIILLPLCRFNFMQTPTRIKSMWYERQEFMPYIADLLSYHNNGNEFVWYESDNRITENTFYIAMRDWRKYIENAFLNYLNKSEGIDFFIVEKNIDNISMDQNILFFYPVDNDQYQPMQDELIKLLQENYFVLYKDSYGILIYRQE